MGRGQLQLAINFQITSSAAANDRQQTLQINIKDEKVKANLLVLVLIAKAMVDLRIVTIVQ